MTAWAIKLPGTVKTAWDREHVAWFQSCCYRSVRCAEMAGCAHDNVGVRVALEVAKHLPQQYENNSSIHGAEKNSKTIKKYIVDH